MFSRRPCLLRLVLASLLGSLLLPIAFTSPALAYSDPITVTSQTDTLAFPKNITFQMSASDAASPITQATLFIMYDEQGYQEQHQVTASPPAQHVTLHWQEDTSNSNFLPPGTQVSYYWQVQDRMGDLHTGITQRFTVVDTRFAWQHVTKGFLQVDWYNHGADFGQAVLTQADDDIQHISANLGGTLSHPANLWVYQTNDDFHGSLSPQTHEWVGGIAFPDLNQASIVIDSMNDQTVSRDMPHELTHLVFHQLIAQGIFAPVWLDEGLAVYNQLYHEPEMTLRLKKALAAHDLLRLDDITLDFPADADKAYLAYAQSWNLVSYMYSTFGRSKMAALIKDMDNPHTDFEQDLVQALGEDQIHLENQWRLSLQQPPVLSPGQGSPTQQVQKPIQLPSTTDSNTPLLLLLGILLIVVPLFGIGGIFAYQRRNRVKARISYSPPQPVQRANSAAYPAMPPYPPMNYSASYTDPARYAPPSYPAPPQPYVQGRPGAPVPQAPYWPPNQPGWGSAYPAPAPDGSNNQPAQANQAAGTSLPPFAPGQEYLNRYPHKQSPQE